MALLKKGTMSELQNYVSDKIKERGFEDETLHERLLLLTEEVGELARACRKELNMNVDQGKMREDNVGEEIADVINVAFAVGIKLGINIEEEYFAKEKKVDQRVYKRSGEEKEDVSY